MNTLSALVCFFWIFRHQGVESCKWESPKDLMGVLFLRWQQVARAHDRREIPSCFVGVGDEYKITVIHALRCEVLPICHNILSRHPKMVIPAPDLESFRPLFIWFTPESILIALYSHVSSFGGKPRLKASLLINLSNYIARQSTNPEPNELPSRPIAAHNARPVPTTFTPLPDDIYLPFIERPAEIAALISSPPDIKLFSLLAQTDSQVNIISLVSKGISPPISYAPSHLVNASFPPRTNMGAH
jgi:hypothetical protein